MKELTEDQHHERVMPNQVKTFGAYRGARENFSFDHHQLPQTMIKPLQPTKKAHHEDRCPPYLECFPWGPSKMSVIQSWWTSYIRCLTIILWLSPYKGRWMHLNNRTLKRWKISKRRMLSSKSSSKSFKRITRPRPTKSAKHGEKEHHWSHNRCRTQ